MKIKNVIFDVGNVLVRWSPLEVIESIFPNDNPQELYQKMRHTWIDLNLGKLSEIDAIKLYHSNLNLPINDLERLMLGLKTHQKPLPGSIQLLSKLRDAGVTLYSITDNVKEIMEYHKLNSDFPKYFDDIISSSDIGVLKPDSKIYLHLLTNHNLNPAESVFIDDVLQNVEGAINVGMKAFQFIDYASCEEKLTELIKKENWHG